MGSLHRDRVTSQGSHKMSVIQHRLEVEIIFLLFRHKKGHSHRLDLNILPRCNLNRLGLLTEGQEGKTDRS